MEYISHVSIGIQALRARASNFERIFNAIAAPATGRWPGLLIWMETHPDYEPWGLLIEHNSEFVAAAILTRYQHFGLWRIGKPGGVGDPVRFGALNDDAAAKLAEGISDAIRDFGGPWIVEISDLAYPSDPVVSHLQSNWLYSQTQQEPPAPCLLFAPNASLNKYLSSNTRSAAAKAYHRIQRDGIQIVQEWIRDPVKIIKLLPQILDIYRRRDHQLRGKSLIDDTAAEIFFVAFVTEHARQGLIDVLTIHLDGELAAFAVCLLDNEKHWVLVNRASPSWLRYSPGTIANTEIVRHAFNDPYSHGVNWGGEPQRYKLSGEVTLVPRQILYAWSSATVRFLFKLRRRFRFPNIFFK
ncbi:MAG TPA: GNAT family N-acetyltransferase [Methylobacter sp.]|jgi:hypothetical protein